MTRLGRVAAAGLLAAAFLRAGAARADEFDGVEVASRSPWPEKPSGGWAPHYVDLENRTDEERHVRVEAESLWGDVFQVTKSVRLAPRERTRLDLVAPVFPPFGSSLQVRVSVAGGRKRYLSTTSTSSFGVEDVRDVLLVASRPPAAGDPERFASDLAAASGPAATGGHRAHRVTHVRPEDLPSRPEPYTSVRLVVLDSSGDWPQGAALEALVSAVRAGARIAIHGDGALEKAKGVPGLREFLEERFLDREAVGAECFHAGFGLIRVRGGARPFEDALDIEAFRALAEPPPWGGLVPVAGYRAHGGAREAVFDALPVRTMTALLLLFSLLMVFGNRAVVKRTRRPALLLVTVPVAGCIASGAFLAYGLFYQGLDVKVAASTLAILDQRTHRVAACERRDLFAGLSPGAGLRPAAGTMVLGHREASWDRSDRFTVNLDEGTLLSGSFIPVRQPIRQTILRDAASRARLDLRLDGDALVAENALGTTVLSLVARDPAGAYHALDVPLAPGATARLERADGEAAGAYPWSAMAEFGLEFEEKLPPGSYAAVVAQAVFRDPLGIEVNEISGAHAVVGILDASEEAWRR